MDKRFFFLNNDQDVSIIWILQFIVITYGPNRLVNTEIEGDENK